MLNMCTITKGRVPVKIYTEDIEQGAYNQLAKIAELPFIHSACRRHAGCPSGNRRDRRLGHSYQGCVRHPTVGKMVRNISRTWSQQVGTLGGQDYAMANRREMMRLTLDALKSALPHFVITKEAINCHHNYVSIEDHFGERVFLTRKGAISARDGELGIIPGSMGAKSCTPSSRLCA